MLELDPLVSEYQHEKHRPREAEALTALQKVASLVKPIMRRRSWRVGTLCEFYPGQRNLLGLNINQGEKICLRLRYPGDERQFLPLEEVVDTMLHELSHIVHGDHDKQFQALWNQLREEHEQLTRKGYTGEGFLSQGKRLGGKRIPLHEARRLARVAAEKRRAMSAGSGQRLGGGSARPGSDIRKVIADAVQRRTTITQGCASGTKEGEKLAEQVSRNGFKTKAEEDDANERAIMQAFIEMIEEDEQEQYGTSRDHPSPNNPRAPQSLTRNTPPTPTSTKPSAASQTPQKSSPDIDIATIESDGDGDDTWACPVCTLVNPGTYLCCGACMSERPHKFLAGPAPNSANKQPLKRALPTPAKPNDQRTMKTRRSAIEALMALEEQSSKKPLGWVCRCGAFMERDYLTCSACGRLTESA